MTEDSALLVGIFAVVIATAGLIVSEVRANLQRDSDPESDATTPRDPYHDIVERRTSDRNAR